ncbi:MAG: pyridoxal phosphate-dependent aminotransferase [Clostridiales bacterium]|nr:pyridoxal phosphate-dependent aminotransferase [Clostridiales bacterium]
MKYSFDELPVRRNTHSLKWDILKSDSELPMWVADMDFYAAPAITDALKKRVESGVFGYNIIPDEWYDAYISWWDRRHGLKMEKDGLIFSTGVIPSLSSIVRKMTSPGDSVLIQTPVYNIFFNSIVNNGRTVLESPLKYENHAYTTDFNDLEEKLSASSTTMMILCNPHNPVGKIWDRETLQKISDLCKKHNVIVVSDEIHCDIVAPGKEYIPFATIDGDCITLIAPTKAFNIAGLQTSAIYVKNREIYKLVNRGLNTDECAEPNEFAVDAAVAAFNEGEDWLCGLNEYIESNRRRVSEFVNENLPDVCLIQSEATYLLWLDMRSYGMTSRELRDRIREKSGLLLSCGSDYGDCGEGFLRMNIACPKALLEDGLARLKKGLQ